MSYSAGPFGGVRAAPHYRVILGELGMVTTSTMFPVSKIQDQFDEDGNDPEGKYAKRIQRFLNELEWYTEALKRQRETCAEPMEPCGDRLAEEDGLQKAA